MTHEIICDSVLLIGYKYFGSHVECCPIYVDFRYNYSYDRLFHMNDCDLLILSLVVRLKKYGCILDINSFNVRLTTEEINVSWTSFFF